jgi:hypothetical protein
MAPRCGPWCEVAIATAHALDEHRRQEIARCAWMSSQHCTGIFDSQPFFMELIMFRKHKLALQLVGAAALAYGVSGAALADGSSMNPFIGDSYAYFNGGKNLGDVWFAQYREAHKIDALTGNAKREAPKVEPKTMIATDKRVFTSVSPFKDNTGGA